MYRRIPFLLAGCIVASTIAPAAMAFDDQPAPETSLATIVDDVSDETSPPSDPPSDMVGDDGDDGDAADTSLEPVDPADDAPASTTTSTTTTTTTSTTTTSAVDDLEPSVGDEHDDVDVADEYLPPTDELADEVFTVADTETLAVQRMPRVRMPLFAKFTQHRPDPSATVTERTAVLGDGEPANEAINTIARWLPLRPIPGSDVYGPDLADAARSALPRMANIDTIVFPVLGPTWFGNGWGDCRGENCERLHVGTDIIGVRLQPIRAAVAGTVTRIVLPDAATGISGASVSVVDHAGFTYHYFHLNNDAPGHDDGATSAWTVPAGLRIGDKVAAGQIIGFMGDSGNSEASIVHLHFEIRDPSGEPVPSFPLLVEAAARETCSIGLGPWSTPTVLPADHDHDPASKVVNVATSRPGALGGSWEVGDDGSVVASGAAALVAPTAACDIPDGVYGTGAGGWEFSATDTSGAMRVTLDRFVSGDSELRFLRSVDDPKSRLR